MRCIWAVLEYLYGHAALCGLLMVWRHLDGAAGTAAPVPAELGSHMLLVNVGTCSHAHDVLLQKESTCGYGSISKGC